MAAAEFITPSPVVPKPRLKYGEAIFARPRFGPTVGELIHRYLKEIESIRPFGQGHRYVLEMLARDPIGQIVAAELRAHDIIEHCRARRANDGVCAATLTQDLTFLRGPLGYAAVGWGMQDVSVRPLKEAMPMIDKLQLAGKSRPRDRRPNVDEYARLHTYFLVQDEDPRSVCKMAVMMEFAVWSCRRISEICRIRWDDVNFEDRTYLIRDMKDPRMKKGNHFLAPALGKAWDIILAQPKVGERIFPWDPKSAGARWRISRDRLGIENLRFHDLRREGICRLFEAGYGPQEVSMVSGHKNWSILARVYANSFPAKDLHLGPVAKRLLAANDPRFKAAA
jgi:integrase